MQGAEPIKAALFPHIYALGTSDFLEIIALWTNQPNLSWFLEQNKNSNIVLLYSCQQNYLPKPVIKEQEPCWMLWNDNSWEDW